MFACIVERNTKTSSGITNLVFSRLNLIDLAGSERISSGAHGGSQVCNTRLSYLILYPRLVLIWDKKFSSPFQMVHYNPACFMTAYRCLKSLSLCRIAVVSNATLTSVGVPPVTVAAPFLPPPHHRSFTARSESRGQGFYVKVFPNPKHNSVPLPRQVEGKHFKEACHINKSLTTLGRVITELVEAQRSGRLGRHIPYRDSRLTFLLQVRLMG